MGVKLADHNTGKEFPFADVDTAEQGYPALNKHNRERGFPDNFTVYDDDGELLSRNGVRGDGTKVASAATAPARKPRVQRRKKT